ncbi:hypothetical protein MHYP_G00257220 [Metynnis hypsauchen]
MMLSARLLLAATALCCIATTFAISMDGFATGHKCRCLTTTYDVIPIQLFRRMEVLPPGPNCGNTEILVTMKNHKVVCVSPDAEWINSVFIKISQKSKKTMKPPALTSKS